MLRVTERGFNLSLLPKVSLTTIFAVGWHLTSSAKGVPLELQMDRGLFRLVLLRVPLTLGHSALECGTGSEPACETAPGSHPELTARREHCAAAVRRAKGGSALSPTGAQ